jgi:hypothetical protein
MAVAHYQHRKINLYTWKRPIRLKDIVHVYKKREHKLKFNVDWKSDSKRREEKRSNGARVGDTPCDTNVNEKSEAVESFD